MRMLDHGDPVNSAAVPVSGHLTEAHVNTQNPAHIHYMEPSPINVFLGVRF